MEDDAGGDGAVGTAPPLQFVSVFHNSEADDDGVATPVGFQDTPDQWYSSRQKKRGSTLADAPTQRDDEATQPQSMATQVQSFATDAIGSRAGYGPSFVDATGSFSSDGSTFDRREDDVDEDETQIMMSLSQDREAMRASARRIEEEELASTVQDKPVPGELMPHDDGNNSDADSEMSDDMLEQDGDANGLSLIAKSFEWSESNDLAAASLKKAPVNVYKPRAPFQVTPPASVIGGDDDSSGAETEVDEEPETTQVLGSASTEQAPLGDPPSVLPVLIKGQSPLRLKKRSASESNVVQAEETKPQRKTGLDRSASCDDVHASPEPAKRPRISLGKSTEGKPPLSRPSRLRLGSDDKTKEVATSSNAIASEAPTQVEGSELVADKATASSETRSEAPCDAPSKAPNEVPNEAPSEPRRSVVEEKEHKIEVEVTAPEDAVVATPRKSAKSVTTPKEAAPQTNRKRKLATRVSDESEVDESDDVDSVKSQQQSQSRTTTTIGPSIRVMFTGLDGTIAKLRAKVKKIADATQEDDEIEQVTHLIAPKNQLKRTVKLLCGISLCDHILDERWLDESARAGVCANEKLHCLKDTAAEAKWNFSLYHTMYEVPKDQRRELFRGLRFFITNHKSVLPPVKDLVKIVECAGGQAETKGSADADHIVITSETALALASTKKALAHADSARINSSELILSSILQQNVDYEAHRLMAHGEAETPSKKKRTKK